MNRGFQIRSLIFRFEDIGNPIDLLKNLVKHEYWENRFLATDVILTN